VDREYLNTIDQAEDLKSKTLPATLSEHITVGTSKPKINVNNGVVDISNQQIGDLSSLKDLQNKQITKLILDRNLLSTLPNVILRGSSTF
jgi:hypothetical protein